MFLNINSRLLPPSLKFFFIVNPFSLRSWIFQSTNSLQLSTPTECLQFFELQLFLKFFYDPTSSRYFLYISQNIQVPALPLSSTPEYFKFQRFLASSILHISLNLNSHWPSLSQLNSPSSLSRILLRPNSLMHSLYRLKYSIPNISSFSHNRIFQVLAFVPFSSPSHFSESQLPVHFFHTKRFLSLEFPEAPTLSIFLHLSLIF